MSTMEDNFFSHSASRLKEERKRLHLSQDGAAAACGISREMWGKYERGKAIPGGDVLFLFATHGADVGFIMTGHRSALAPDESVLVEGYRKLDGRGKAGLLAYLAGANAPDAARATFNGPVGTAINGDMHIGNFKGKIGG